MKAYVLKDVGKFEYMDVETPVCDDGEAIVKVMATGICGSDIPRIYKTGTYSYPLIPGHEFSGIVTEVGKNVVSSWLGKRVGVFPLIPCEKCEPCQARYYELCRNYSYLGSRTDGGFAEFVKVPAWNLIELPRGVTYEQAAMLEPMAVAVHALRRSEILPYGRNSDVACDMRKDDKMCAGKMNIDSALDDNRTYSRKVAICGMGTIGLLIYMFLMERGIKNVHLIGNKKWQMEMAIRMGAEEHCFSDVSAECFCDVDETNAADVFFDCAGTNSSVNLAIENTTPGGTVVLVGNPASDMKFDKRTYWKILRNQLDLRGVWNSSFTHEENDDWHYCLRMLGEGRIMPEKLILHRLPFERLKEGAELMRDKTEPYTKVMLLRGVNKR